jgi:hypothetical protein
VQDAVAALAGCDISRSDLQRFKTAVRCWPWTAIATALATGAGGCAYR